MCTAVRPHLHTTIHIESNIYDSQTKGFKIYEKDSALALAFARNPVRGPVRFVVCVCVICRERLRVGCAKASCFQNMYVTVGCVVRTRFFGLVCYNGISDATVKCVL